MINLIKNKNWIIHWSGGWSILSCSYFGHQYTKTIHGFLGAKLDNSILVFKEGKSTCYLEKTEVDKFGKQLALKISKKPSLAKEWSSELKNRTDVILGVINNWRGNPDKEVYKKFIEALYSYVEPHIAVKKVVDYLDTESLKKYLPIFEEARIYAEKVYDESERFMQEFARSINPAKQKQILCTLKEEFNEYLLNEKDLPSDFEDRYTSSALIFKDGKEKFLIGGKALEVESSILEQKKNITGKTAYPGHAIGTARIIINPNKYIRFDEGDILVTAMTRPEYIPLIKKSAAFITDGGGVLSHAAITAREIRKPCIIGTEVATKMIKDGMKIEVDATKGIVNFLK